MENLEIVIENHGKNLCSVCGNPLVVSYCDSKDPLFILMKCTPKGRSASRTRKKCKYSVYPVQNQ